MKVLSYSLFGDPSSFEFGYYLRGTYFNARMNRILFPEFETVVHVDYDVYNKYFDFIGDLFMLTSAKIYQVDDKQERCRQMLWRLLPIWGGTESFNHVICRDLDSVSTYREALCTYEWLNSGMPYHAINDNAAHGGLMGGLVSFRSEDFKRDTRYTSFDQMIKGQKLDQHGSDQNFMNKHLHPKIKKGLMMHKLKGAGIESAVTKTEVPASGPIDKRLWLSNLVQPYVGSAGCVDMELIRFFQSVDNNPKFDEFERKHKSICYWRQ
jgi:hypothetical protein